MKNILLICCMWITFSGFSQTQLIHRKASIAQMIDEISAENLEKYVRDLSDFRTRHSLSKGTNNKEWPREL